MLNYHNETTEHYRVTLENLAKVNHTVNYVVEALEDTRQSLESKLNWALSLLGGTGKTEIRISFMRIKKSINRLEVDNIYGNLTVAI